MKLLVLAGGFGTRLRTVVSDVPKALAPIGHIPFLQIQIDHWRMQGLTEFTFLLHHQAGQVVDFLESLKAGLLNGCQVDCLIEPTPMDTGGAVSHAVRELGLTGDFLVTNADTWLGGGVRELMESASPAMAVVNLSDVSRYGKVYFDHSNQVTAFVEKNGQHVSGWINAGLYRLSSALFKDWDGGPFSLERNLFLKLVQNHGLMAVPLQTDFIDIGVPDDYYHFCGRVEAQRHFPPCN